MDVQERIKTYHRPADKGWVTYYVSPLLAKNTLTRLKRSMLTSEKSGTPRKKNSMERIIFATAVQYEPADESRYSDLCYDLSQGGLYLQTVYPFDTDEKLAL